ncbi:MAG: glutaminase A [Gemmatimonas sp.]|jgi:glutaminase|nr:glutaminase A [Gemmatimonas sp.]
MMAYTNLIDYGTTTNRVPSIEAIQREARLFAALDDDGDGLVHPRALQRELQGAGLRITDSRLSGVFAAIEACGENPMDLATFTRTISSGSLLVERALQGSLAVADFGAFQQRMAHIFDLVLENRSGDQARYIPPLAEVNPEQFGVSIVTVDGQQLELGDSLTDFSIQSTCKPFNYALALEDAGEEIVHRHIGREPSGQRFNAYVLSDDNRPHNPMINAGAIMCCSLIKRDLPLHRRFEHIRDAWERMTGGFKPRFNAFMTQEEERTGDRNRALAYMMKNEGLFPDGHDAEDHQVRAALDLYFRTCSLEMNCLEMATAAATLANGGVCPTTLERVQTPTTVRNALSLMHSCGMYDYSGEFAFTIGLPAKSGVGGAVVLVVPGLMGICLWSPRLDKVGNSVRGVDFSRRLLKSYTLHMYDSVTHDRDRDDPRVPVLRRRVRLVSQSLWAASTGDARTVRRMLDEGADMELGDYDLRSPLHLAAAEGHLDVVQLLLDAGVSPNPRDRWGGTPLDDALGGGHELVADTLNRLGATSGTSVHLAKDRATTDASASYGDPEAVVELLWAAAGADLAAMRRLVALGVPLHAADYDGRTALHLGAAAGHVHVCEYLLRHGHPRSCRDRWGATPLDEARREERLDVLELLERQ